MVLALYADDPLQGKTNAYVTWCLIAANIIVFIAVLSLSPELRGSLLNIFGFTPAIEIRDKPFDGIFPRELTTISSMFIDRKSVV